MKNRLSRRPIEGVEKKIKLKSAKRINLLNMRFNCRIMHDTQWLEEKRNLFEINKSRTSIRSLNKGRRTTGWTSK